MTSSLPATMHAIQVSAFGGSEAMQWTPLPLPLPGAGQILIKVEAAGVGPWDAWVRSGRSALPQPLPLILGSDVAGTVVQLGIGSQPFAIGEPVYGVTNGNFTGGYSEYALCEVGRMAKAPDGVPMTTAAAIPVIACTAWQMIHTYAKVQPGWRVLILGGAGMVGGCLVQVALSAGAEVAATGLSHEQDALRELGVSLAIDGSGPLSEAALGKFDAVLDTVGGRSLEQSYDLVKPGGILISSVEKPDQARASGAGFWADFFIVNVHTKELEHIAGLVEQGKLRIRVGEIVPLCLAARAHEMLEGRIPRKPGKIVLIPDRGTF